MNKKISTIIASLGLFIAQSAFAGFGLGVAPTYSELIVEPGKVYRQKITVANMGTGKPLSLVVGSAVWVIDSNGEIKLTAPTQDLNDPNQWLKFSPTSFTLGPQKNMEILVDINVPLNAEKKEYRVALISSTVLPSQDVMKKSKNVWEKIQIASLMYLATSKDLVSVPTVSIEKNKNSKNLSITLNNDGDKHSRISGVLSFYDGETKISSQELNYVLMANQKRVVDFKVDVPDSFKGKKLKIVPELSDTMSKDFTVSVPKEIEYGF